MTVTGRARFARAGVLKGAGNLAWYQGDYEVARSLLEEGLAIGRDLGDGLLIATSLRRLGDVARLEGDHPSAQSLYEESLTIRRTQGGRLGIAVALSDLGDVA